MLPANSNHEPAHASQEAVAAPAGEATASVSPANKSTAARKDVPNVEADTFPPRHTHPEVVSQDRGGGRDAAIAGTQAPPVDTPIRQDEPVDAAVDGPQTVDGRRNSETPGAGAPAAGGGAHNPTPPAVSGDATPIVRIKPTDLRPFCRHKADLTKCGGYGKTHCHECLVAHAEAEGFAA